MENTFRTTADFKQGWRGKRAAGDYFLVVRGRAADGTYGLVIGKSAGKAVTRNRVRRLARELVVARGAYSGSLLIQVKGNLPKGLKEAGGLATVENAVLRAELERLLRKVGL